MRLSLFVMAMAAVAAVDRPCSVNSEFHFAEGPSNACHA